MNDDFKELYDNLKDETQKLNTRLKELEEKNKYLLSRVSELVKENEDLKSNASDEIRDEAAAQAAQAPKAAKTEPSPDFEYGAKAIGKILISAASACNSLSAKSDNPITKELINLILGKSEAAKADVLKIIRCESELEIKKEMIDKVVNSSQEYFINVRAQI